jgi:hypothetical protein
VSASPSELNIAANAGSDPHINYFRAVTARRAAPAVASMS